MVKRRSASWWGRPVKGRGSTPPLVYRLVYALLVLMGTAGFGGLCLAAEPVRLSLDDPYRDGDYVKIDFTLRGIALPTSLVRSSSSAGFTSEGSKSGWYCRTMPATRA